MGRVHHRVASHLAIIPVAIDSSGSIVDVYAEARTKAIYDAQSPLIIKLQRADMVAHDLSSTVTV